jgi:hypothetical protein
MKIAEKYGLLSTLNARVNQEKRKMYDKSSLSLFTSSG